MRAAVLAALAAPAAGAWLSMVTAPTPRARRVVHAAAAAAGIAAVAVLGGFVAAGRTFAGGGLTADAWRVVLVATALIPLAPLAARRAEAPASVAIGSFVAAGAAVAAALSSSVVGLAVALPVVTAGFAVAAAALRHGAGPDDPGPPAAGLRAGRAAAALAGADVLAIGAIVLVAGDGLAGLPEPGTVPALMLLASAAVRLGLPPVAFAAEDAVEADAATAAVAFGPVRATGLLLAAIALRGPSEVAAVAAVIGVVAAGFGAWRAMREGSIAAAAAAHAGIVVVGFASGGAAGARGAVLLAAAGAIVWPLVLAGGGARMAGRAGAGVWVIGGTLPGAVLVAEAATRGAGARPAWTLAGIAVAGAAAVLAAAAPGLGRDGGEPGVTTPAWTGWWAAPAALAVLAVAVLPGEAAARLAAPAAATFGIGSRLGIGEAGGLSTELGLVAGAVALGAATAVLRGARGTSLPAPVAAHLRLLDWWAAAAAAPSMGSSAGRERAEGFADRAIRVAIVLLAVAAALSAWVYAIGVRRGFL